MDNYAFRKSNRAYTRADYPKQGEYRRLSYACTADDIDLIRRLQGRRKSPTGRVPGFTSIVREALDKLDKMEAK